MPEKISYQQLQLEERMVIASLRLQDLRTFLTRSAWIWPCWKARFDIWFPPGRTSHASQVNIEQ